MNYDDFTIKEVVHGTGLSKQRVHILIKTRDIPVHKDRNKFIVKWYDLLKAADNPSMLRFLKITLAKERNRLEEANQSLKKNAEIYQYGVANEYARILLQSRPELTTDELSVSDFSMDEASNFFKRLISGKYWKVEKNKEALGTTMTKKAPRPRG
jgi:hypothetical protein